ncbi:MAG: VWA domain-containing protein [Methanosarcinales archaeon]
MNRPCRILLMIVTLALLCGLAVGLEIEIIPESIETPVGDSVNVTITVLNNSTPQKNTLVNLTTSLGNLSAESAYTNGSGMAVVWVNSTIAGIATVNASVNATYNTTNVSFTPGTPSSIETSLSQNPIRAGNKTRVNLTAYDEYQNVNTTADVRLNLTIRDILGEITEYVEITRAPGTLTEIFVNYSAGSEEGESEVNLRLTNKTDATSSNVSLFINSTLAGNFTLTATAGSATKTTKITYTPAAPHTMAVSYDDEYTVNTTYPIRVRVSDRYGNPVEKTTLNFTATPPPNTKYNSPIEYNSLTLTPEENTTRQDGVASTIFRTDKRAGTNTINITIPDSAVKTTITITGVADHACDLLLSRTPGILYANNEDKCRLHAQTVDQFLNPVLPDCCPITEKVRFTTTGGTTLIPLNETATATTLVGPTPYVETVDVYATYENATGPTNITNTTHLSFIAGSLASFIFYASPSAVLTQNLSGNHNSTLTLVALDEWGHTLPEINVTLESMNTTLGEITIPGVNATDTINTSTNTNGRVYATFTSRTQAGNATITARNETINASTTVEIKDQPFLSVNITIEPESINSSDTVNVTTIVSVEGELPITRPAASAMLVLDRSGSMDPDCYAGTPLDVVLVLDRSGSMKFLGDDPEQPMTDAKTAAKVFMENLVSNAQVGVVSFEDSEDTGIDINLTLLNSSDNKTLVRDAIDGITAGGSTAMGDGMAYANTMLINGRSDARKIMIVLTDGVCNDGSDCDGSTAISTANANSITIYTIGLGSASYIDEPLLQRIATETGGTYYNAPTSSDLQSVYNSIAQEISDYDITKIEYGDEGFTPHDYETEGSLVPISNPTYTLRFEGYDLDDHFDASPNYGGSDAGECLIQINGVNFTLIPPPSHGTRDCNPGWMDYEYDITNLVQNGSNTVTFYDYHDYCTGSPWNNEIRNVEVLANNTRIAYYPAEVDIKGDGYSCQFSDDLPFASFIDTFIVNESVNDFKVLLRWDNSSADLNLTLTSPDGNVYGAESTGSVHLEDDYERGSLGSNYSTGGDQSWTTTTDDYHSGKKSAQSGNISDGETTWLDRTVTLNQSGSVEFWYRISSERYHDFFNFYIDGVEELHVAGNTSWMRFNESLDAGTHTIKWEYVKDGSGSEYDDCVYIDEMKIRYGVNNTDTTGYYFDDREAVPIDLRSPEFDTYITSASPNTVFTDETSFYVTDEMSGSGEEACSIMRWKLPSAPTDNARIESVTMYLRGISSTSDPGSEPRSINIYDLVTGYGDDPTWNSSDNSASEAWANGSFSSADIDSYLIDSVALSSSIDDEVVEFNITSANWSGDRLPDWGEECNIVLLGEGYDGAGADQFASSETDTEAHHYTLNGWRPLVTVTYTITRETSEYIWIHPLPYTYPDTDAETVENGVWTVQVTAGTGSESEEFNITTYIDKKSAVKLASHAFISSFNETNGDRCGLVLYSNESVANRFSQSSYVRNNSTWVGYFDVPTVSQYTLRFDGYDLDYSGDCRIDVNGETLTWVPPPSSGNGQWKDDYEYDITDYVQDGLNVVSFYDPHDYDNKVRNVEIWNETGVIVSYPSVENLVPHHPYNCTFNATRTPFTFNLTWDNQSDNLDLYLYKGVDVVASSNNTTGFEEFSLYLEDATYHVIVNGTNVLGNTSRFNLTVSQDLDWTEWHADLASTLNNDTLLHLNTSINNFTADGLTAIDEGMFVANGELASVSGNSTMVLMTDGLDNAGYHSLLLEAERAAANNTVIYTVGFGSSESEVDPVLSEIANITGGEYYFAPSASVLQSIFRGIAANITNFTASGPTMNLLIPHNYITNLSLATATYVANSSNATWGNSTNVTGGENGTVVGPGTGNAEPNINTVGNITTLTWDLPSLGVGESWGVWYQLVVEGAGFIPLILPGSNLTYTDVNGENITVNITFGGGTSTGGSGADVDYIGLGSLELSADPTLILIGETSNITMRTWYTDGNPAIASVQLYTDIGYFNHDQTKTSIAKTVSGSDRVNLTSPVAGVAHIRGSASNANNTVGSLVVVVVRPKGAITIS